MNKKYLVALIVVALFATASVSANTAFKRLAAVERPDYKLVVNKDAVELQNNPITIDGVTYLPLREVATILDQEVGFDKGTITLDSKTTTVVKDTAIEDKIIIEKESGDNKMIETTEWISLRELASNNVEVMVDQNSMLTVKKETSSVSFLTTDIVTNSTVSIKTDSTDLTVKSSNGQTYLLKSELQSLGIID